LKLRIVRHGLCGFFEHGRLEERRRLKAKKSLGIVLICLIFATTFAIFAGAQPHHRKAGVTTGNRIAYTIIRALASYWLVFLGGCVAGFIVFAIILIVGAITERWHSFLEKSEK